MPRHVYPHFKNPANNTQKKAGYYTACYLQIRNNGNGGAQCYLGINRDGNECGKHIYNVWLEPGAAKNANPCEFTMPDRRVKIEYFGGHHDGNVWVEDFSDVIYIDPEAPVVTYCSQTVRAVDSGGRALSGVRLHLTNSKNEYKNTDNSGYATFTNLAQGRTHYISGEKSGYSSSGTKSFIACTGTITLVLGVTCNCTDWVKQECIRDGVRRYTRTCTPSGCQPEERTISDTRCVGAAPPEEPSEMPPGGPYEKWKCTTVREFDVWTGVKYIHITEVKCYCPDGISTTTQVQDYNWDWLETVMSRRCVPQVAEGEITLCNINALPCPNCGKAKEGIEIVVVAEMKNTGNKLGEFRFYIYDQDGHVLSKEPDFSYKNVAAGATWKVTKTLTTNLNFKMLNKLLNGELKLVKQT